MQSRETILAPGLVTADVQIQPVLNALNSHRLLAMTSIRTGLDAWVHETAARLTDEQYRWIKMLYYGFTGITYLEKGGQWGSFEEFLAAYERISDPRTLIHAEAEAWCANRKVEHNDPIPTLDRLIDYREHYIDMLMADDDPAMTREIAGECHRFLTEPDAMHAGVVTHLREMWVLYLKPEWERRAAEVERSAAALRATAPQQSTLVETMRLLTGRDITGWMAEPYYAHMQRAIFVPSPHMGPYISVYETDDPYVARFSFGARVSDGQISDPSNPVSGFEIKMRLEALADPLRLEIVRLMSSQQSMSTEEIMETFDLTKSSASRHLRLLTATGLLSERREGGAKKVYGINRETALHTIRALHRLLLGDG